MSLGYLDFALFLAGCHAKNGFFFGAREKLILPRLAT
jgi:hypothetical protein